MSTAPINPEFQPFTQESLDVNFDSSVFSTTGEIAVPPPEFQKLTDNPIPELEFPKPEYIRERIDRIHAKVEQTYQRVKESVGETAVFSSLVADPWTAELTPSGIRGTSILDVIHNYPIINTPEVKMRGALPADIETLVEIDMRAFKSVYKSYDQNPEQLKAELIEKFKGRLDIVGSDWIQIAEIDGVPRGFMIGCPTSKSPEEFESWEKTTDNGTLETTYDPNGDYVYVVSLSVLPDAANQNAHNMLITNMIGKGISKGYELAFFESRLPSLKKWVQRKCREDGMDFETLTSEQKDQYAELYTKQTKVVDGKTVRHDRLLRTYDAQGCKFVKIARNAYKDNPSMNYGVVYTMNNPLPKRLQKIPLFAKSLGGIYQLVARSPRLLEKFIG